MEGRVEHTEKPSTLLVYHLKKAPRVWCLVLCLLNERESRLRIRSACDIVRRHVYACTPCVCVFYIVFACWYDMKIVIWLILPVVIRLSQRLSHACLSISNYTVKLRMAHYISYSLFDSTLLLG